MIELGTEGRLVQLQMEELMLNVREDRAAVLADYLPDPSPERLAEAREALVALRSEELISLARSGEVLGYGPNVKALEKHMSPRGYRMLRKIPRLGDAVVEALICRFGSVRSMFDATVEELAAVDGVDPVRANDIQGGSGATARTEPAGALRMTLRRGGHGRLSPAWGRARSWTSWSRISRVIPRLYYNIRILHNDMTVMVPVDGVEKAGIRAVMTEPMVDEVLGVLRDDPTKMPKDWNRRIKHNREKIKSGDVLEIADVLRNLALRRAGEGTLHGREADVRQGQAASCFRGDVRQAHPRGRCPEVARRHPRGDLRSTAVRGAGGPWYSL